MAKRAVSKSDEPRSPILIGSLESAKTKIDAQKLKGEQLKSQLSSRMNSVVLDRLENEVQTWHEFNGALISKLLGINSAELYRTHFSIGGFGEPLTVNQRVDDLRSEIDDYLRQLTSIADRLPLWEKESLDPPQDTSIERPMDGSIFLVHGSDDVRKVEVARMLEQATGREVVILHEQPNRGRTLIEKFEDHAGSAAFAVVILTADDEGRHKGTDSDLMLRGRQNVVFEMGFFFAALGRSRVVVLLDDGIEKPSDVDGIVYVGLDSEGVWKLLLAKELAAATIHVDLSKIV